MFAKTFNGETRKLYITKAGLQVGEEKYIKEETREGISLKVHTVYSTGGKKEEQESQLLSPFLALLPTATQAIL